MKRETIYIAIVIAALVTVFSCQKPLDIKATDSNANVLVVEGFINTADSTKIILSRTVVIGNKTTANPVGNATVVLENLLGTVATLREISKGNYATPQLILDNTKQYRIRITTNGKSYVSDFTEAKVTPLIDNISFTTDNTGLHIYANTHDDTNNSRYYLHTYEETWAFHTRYLSSYRTNGVNILPRTPAEFVNFCYGFQASVNVILNSTAALTKDVLYQGPITNIDKDSEKLSLKYSILVTQTALTKDAYNFWDNLRKNTEKLGSIFDAQPSQLVGNIHCVTDASEPVIGYISAGTKQTKRIFISNADLPSNFGNKDLYNCKLDTALFITSKGERQVLEKLIPLGSEVLPVDEVRSEDIVPRLLGYSYSYRDCTDCTTRGRVPKPSFWP